jgi:ribosomal protein L11 methyltransferase
MTALWRVSVRARGDDAEPLRARLLALAPDGLEELDFGDTVELAVYVADAEVDESMRRLPDAVAQPVAEGWEDGWRAFHEPVEIGGLWIGPPWDAPADRTHAIVIDPGRAFGTGGHPTTRLSVERLAASPVRGSLLDVGCGSGVLAIAGARLGFAPVRAVDIDPGAVETTLGNARVNGVEIEACVAAGVHDVLGRADLVTANVLLRPVEKILERLDARAAITSGYLAGERPRAPGWEHVDRREGDGWAADTWARAA